MIARLRQRFTKRRSTGVLAAAAIVSVALIAQGGVTTTEASWNDQEWVNGPVGTVDCDVAEGAFATRGEGRLLSGSLLGINLDDVAAATGVTVTGNGSRLKINPAGSNPVVDPPSSPASAPTAYSNPVNVTALNSALDVNLGAGLLQFPLAADTAAVGQFGQAELNGKSKGASGLLTNTGGIAAAPENGYPDLAKLDLSKVLDNINPEVSAALTQVTDVSLTAGAVAGRAELDGCASVWATDATSGLVREYLASSVDLGLESETVGGLVTNVSTIVENVDSTVDSLTSAGSPLVNGILGGLTGLLGSLLTGLTTNVTVTQASVSLDSVRNLLDDTVQDDGEVLSINLSNGEISVSTAALLESAYPGNYGLGLNGLEPNKNLLQDPKIATALSDALTGALTNWIAAVESALLEAIDGIQISAQVQIRVPLVASVTATVGGSLQELENGKLATITTSGLLGGALGQIVTLLTSGLGGVVAAAVQNLVVPLASNLVTQVSAPISLVTSTVSNLYSVLFLDGVVAVTVNAQNDPLEGSLEPSDWTTSANAGIPEGQYDVAALRIGMFGALRQNDVHVYLGRGSVGQTCSMAEIASGGCANY